MISKICLSLEIYSYNKENLILVEKMKGISILMDIIIYHQKLFIQVESKDQEQLLQRKQLYTSVLRCITVCLRAHTNITEFI